MIRVLLDTLKYCPDLNIVHRDIKPEVGAACFNPPPSPLASDIYSINALRTEPALREQ